MSEIPRPRGRRRLDPGALRGIVRRSRRLRVALVMLGALAAGLSVDLALDRAERARARWEPAVTVWVAHRDVAAGTRLGSDDVGPTALPVAALPADAATVDPAGRRTSVDLAPGEIVREARLRETAGATAAGLPAGTGAVALPAPAPHLTPGDVVDLLALLDGRRVATAAVVVAVVDDHPVVAVADDDLASVVATFTTGDVVPVLVG